MRVVGYVRVSSEEQLKGSSLQAQEVAIREHCLEVGHQLIKIFREEGISAKTPDRPQLNELVKFCSSRSNAVELLIVHNFDRFSRNAEGHAIVRTMLKKAGVGLYSIQQPLGDTSADRFIETVFSGLAELDNDMRAERVIAGMKACLLKGLWMWAAPIGYVRGERKTSPSLFVVEDTAKHIRYAFEQAAAGVPRAKILLDLDRRGMRTKRGKKISKQSLNGILGNSLYTGEIKTMGVVAKGDFEPIISVELFDKVNTKYSNQRGVAHPKLNSNFPLRRFIKCAYCKKPVTGSNSTGRGGKKYGHYRCENSACRKVKLRKEKLEALFEEELDRLSVRPQSLDLLEAVAQDVWRERTSEDVKARSALQHRIEAVMEKKDRLLDAYVQEDKIDGETYERRMRGYEDEIEEARSLIPQETLSQAQLSSVIADSKALLTDLSNTWNHLEIQQKVAFQQLVYPNGLCCDGEKLGTTKKSWLFIDFIDENNRKNGVVRPPGLEPGTCRLRVCCSAN